MANPDGTPDFAETYFRVYGRWPTDQEMASARGKRLPAVPVPDEENHK